VPQFPREVLGVQRLEELARTLYTDGEDPAAALATGRSYTFHKVDSHYEVHLRLPFATKGEVGLFKKGAELVVEVGTLRRHIGLPTSMAGLAPARARLDNKLLIVELKEAA
jgi:arsenite-transporting ATPase